jgi:putative DNA methylase
VAKKGATRVAGKTKKQILDEAIAEAVGAGQKISLETVDFSNPNREKTCLEVDFPILSINQVATIEGNASKPIYQMSKWWARRRSSVFRAMLIAGATKAPDDPGEAAKLVWDSYYANHQDNIAFRSLKVADIFMGGGTTVVEGSRLGMQMYGNDLNPVAWFVVKNELAQVDAEDVQRLLTELEAEVKPRIIPFYTCDCPRGHKGKWKNKLTDELMGTDFNPLNLSVKERSKYTYTGPEIIYTFWAKHGPCQSTGCGHRTPIMSSPVIAVKKLTVKAWLNRNCKKCNQSYDIEQHNARMAPGAELFKSAEELPYTEMNEKGEYSCPHCGELYLDQHAKINGVSSQLGKATNKSVDLTLLVHPDWLLGSPSTSSDGSMLGGCATDSPASTAKWTLERQRSLKLIEFRGVLPDEIEIPATGKKFSTKEGTVPKKSTFSCMNETCGKQWDVLEAIKATKKTGPASAYAIQGYCPECDANKLPYSGRFFSVPNEQIVNAAISEWSNRKEDDLSLFWPRSEVPYGFMTSMNNGGIPNHGFTHWWTMFNARQLLVHSQILQSITLNTTASALTKEAVLGAFQQYLRNQNLFCIWNLNADKMEPMFSNNNYHPKATMIENCVFPSFGRGNWTSSSEGIVEGLQWRTSPWETLPVKLLAKFDQNLTNGLTGLSTKVQCHDPVLNDSVLECSSSSELVNVASDSVDLVITDPPFGGLLHYSELSDFFYVWLRLFLKETYPRNFTAEYTPKALEAVANRAREPEDADGFYKKILTNCWKEAARILKPAGILAFTFHHSEDEPWVAVLESLFNAGFYLEAAYPIRSDETKGEGAKPGTFGSQLIEYDIVHVCRKRIDEPNEISWARLRKKILQDVRQLQDILEHHQNDGLAEADLQVIRRGKALEYYSKHYGKVYVEKGREFTVKEALAGINQLLDDQRDSTADVPPIDAEPYTRQFLRLFADALSLPRDQLQKYLRGTGVAPNEFLERGWCIERGKVFYMTPPIEQAAKWKGAPRKGLGKDLDQAMFLIGACTEKSGINVNETLNNQNFIPHPALYDILDWFSRHGGDDTMKGAAQTARQLYKKWLSNNEPKVKQVQQTLFDLMGDGE